MLIELFLNDKVICRSTNARVIVDVLMSAISSCIDMEYVRVFDFTITGREWFSMKYEDRYSKMSELLCYIKNIQSLGKNDNFLIDKGQSSDIIDSANGVKRAM